MSKRIVISFVAVLLGALFVGVSYAKPLAPTIRIGVLTTSSGPLYFAGAVQKAASKLAAEDLFDDGVKTSLFYEEIGSADPKVAFRKLKANDVDVVIGPIDSASTKTVLQANIKDPVSIISASQIADEIDGSVDGTNWIFRTATTISQDNNALVELLARDKKSSVALVTGTDSYSLAARRTLAFGLTFSGVNNLSLFSMNELKALRKTRPDVLVIATMEESVPFMNQMADWVDGVKKVYLIPGNMANYSMFPWVENLAGAQGIAPTDAASSSFRSRLASAMDKPYLVNSSNSLVFALGKRIYDSIMLAGGVYRSGDSALGFRNRLAQAKADNRLLFSADGYYRAQKYTIYRYGSEGLFAPVGIFERDTP